MELRTGCLGKDPCPQYSRQLGRCKAGKIIPPTIKGGVQAAKMMGLSYICKLSDKRDKIKTKILREDYK